MIELINIWSFSYIISVLISIDQIINKHKNRTKEIISIYIYIYTQEILLA